jgi:protein involved in polysaccharide export with SLBB domain
VVVPSAAPITVLGKIQQPQTFPVPQNASFTVRRAIAMAGGFTENANKHAVSLLRDGEVSKVNVSRLVSTADNEGEALGETPLLPGDTIIVSAAQTVAVLGKVNEPTVFPLPENVPVTVTRAIAMAGGFKDIAKMNSVLHFRDGQVTKVNVSKILDQNSDQKLDIVLKPGDIVYVSESRW